MSTHPARTLVHRLCHRPRMMPLVMWMAATLLPVASATAQQGGTVAATATVRNRAVATVALPGGATASVADSATVSVSYLAGVRLSPGTTATVRPGGVVALAHTLENAGTRTDVIALSASAPATWQATVHHDVDGDGTLSAPDSLVAAPTLAAGATMRLLVRVAAPAGAVDSSSATIRLDARSTNAPAATADAADTVTVVGPRARLTMTKTAGVATAAHGDVVRYSLAARNEGDAASDTATIVDTLPRSMTLVAGSLSRDGVALAPVHVTTAPDGRSVIRVPVGAMPAGSTTSVQFDVHLATGSARDSVVNTAALLVGPAIAASGIAAVAIDLADLALDKSIAGDTSVALGGELTWRIRVANASGTATAYDVVVTDTLPAEMQLVTAQGTPATAGQVLTWSIPTLAPGASATWDVTVRVVRLVPGGTVVNTATAAALNARTDASASATALLDVTPGTSLAMTKRAGALEVGLGEAVPYVLTVRNRSPFPLTDIVVHDRLPDGMELAGRMVTGADSIRIAGRDVTMFVAGPLAPDAEQVIRYNGVLTSARSRSLVNLAAATADGGRVLSDTAAVAVRVRRGFEVENRTLVGKVWFDRDDDGRQEPGEAGVPGVDVWTSDGVVVTTDREGRFSLRDVPTGQHALRLDMTGVPDAMRLPEPGAGMVIVRADGWTLPAVEFRLVPAPGAPPCECPDSTTARPAAVMMQGTAADSVRPAVSDELLLGPAVRYLSPESDAVVHTARIYVGARGEPNRPVRLYVDDSLVTEARLRPDGIHDFIGVPLAPGPHVLRLWMRNSWGNERWDTVMVHRSGPAASFELEWGTPSLHPAERSERPVRVRVLDRWRQPVADGLQVTVEATGATVEGEDTDKASLGLQRPVAKDGWVSLQLRGGPTTGPAILRLRSGATRGAVTLHVLPVIRPMMVMGNAEVGVGAATPSYGAVTARGAIDARTAVSVTYDSRRTRDEDDLFARAVDPMHANQYPTLGDGSTQAAPGTGSTGVSARIERDYDWLEFGDITPRTMAGAHQLFDYRRALSGVQGRVSVGSFTVQGFGSLTSQQLQERQIAATNGSGPYALGSDLRPGTERILIEVRARDNAARIIDRRELARIVDYELDHRSGALLLRRPLASMDAHGNPVYIVAWVERAAGGPSRFVGGGRIETGYRPFTSTGVLDSITVAVSAVHDAAGGAANSMTPTLPAATGSLDVLGADLRLQRGTATLELSLLRSRHGDSTALASRAKLGWESLDERWSAGAEWTRVDAGFGGGLDPRLAAGYRELRVSTGTRLGRHGRAALVHEQQFFEQYGVDRRNTYLRAEQRRGDRALTQELGLLRDGTRVGTSPGAASTAHGRLELSASERANLWLEGSRGIEGAALQPDRFGAGAGYRLFGRTRLEATHFLNRVENGDDYATSGVNLRTETPLGGRAWGGVERASAARASHAALLGIEQRLRVSRGWELQGMYERRVGLDAASPADPARGLPFPQLEADRSLASLGVSFVPGGDRSRVTLRSELQEGAEQHGFRIMFAGDVPLGPDLALLGRSDWSQYERTVGTVMNSRQDRSLLGLAFRPTRSNDVNALAKVEWRRTLNPLGSAALSDSADARRMIATSDLVWTPGTRTELAARYAVRWADWRYAGVAAPAAPVSHYVGVRGEQAVVRRIGLRVDARLLEEQSSATMTWSVAPALTVRLTPELRLEAGYRAGTMQDLDFGESRSKLFATMGFHFTEQTLGAAAFWRDRLVSDR